MKIKDKKDWAELGMTETESPWIATYTGGKFHAFDLRESEIKIEDIAHALSLTCRYTGHCKWHYSVAQHCVLVSHLVPKEDSLWGLLHDASEAYLCDMAGPFKHTPEFENYRTLEHKVQRLIYRAFGLQGFEPASIKQVDHGPVLSTESHTLMPKYEPDWTKKNRIPGLLIEHWSPERAEKEYLDRFYDLIYDDLSD